MNQKSDHILSAYNDELAGLATLRREMADTTLGNLKLARQGVLECRIEPCLAAIADDEQVNRLDAEIEARALAILARFHPVARDLREVVATMRISTNLERAADEAKTIGKRGRSLAQSRATPDLATLEPLFEQAVAELADACKAFENKDIDLAATIRQRDKDLDKAYKAALRTYTESLPTASDAAPSSWLDLLLITRALERIGDHAKNIAEETAFFVGPVQS